MANLKKRLLISIILTSLSLVSIILLLPEKHSKQLQQIALGTNIDNFGGVWGWGGEEVEDDRVEETGGGIRLVVFGDSWVDDSVEKGSSGKGRSWPEVLCEEINCTSRLNFAASQPGDAFPALEPTGVATSNKVLTSAVAADQPIPISTKKATPLPDLAAQIQSFIALPVPKEQSKQTIFVLSFGFWDIYEFSRLSYNVGQNATDTAVGELFEQLDILYLHFAEYLYPASALPSRDVSTEVVNATDVEKSSQHTFRIIIPRLFDPTLLPGWLSHRPLPVAPSSIAEQQKNAAYLTDRWNMLLENKMGSWINSPPPVRKAAQVVAEVPAVKEPKPIVEEASHTDVREPTPSIAVVPSLLDHTGKRSEPDSEIGKDVFYFDASKYLLDIIIEHNLEAEGISDASGLGKGESPYYSVYIPCVRNAEDGEDTDGLIDVNGLLVCKEPKDYLFWDAWGLGPAPKEDIGRKIAMQFIEGKSLRAAWEKAANHN